MSAGNKKDMKVIILMSVYNGYRYLKEQIESIRNQTIGYENIYLVIRDDGSKDQSCQLIHQMQDPHITLIEGENCGTADSFWKLIKETTADADYYAFADQDDIWYSSKLETAIECLNRTDTPQLYYSNAEIADNDGRGTGRLLMKRQDHLSVPTIMAGLHALGCTMVFNRTALKVFQSVRLSGIEMHDRSCFLIMYLVGQVIFDSKPQLYYRQHENNVIGNEGKKGWIYYRKKLRRSYALWFRSRSHDAVIQSQDMLKNFGEQLKTTDRNYLYMIANYRSSWLFKKKLLLDKNIKTLNKRVRRSYCLRILINVF